MEQKKMNMISTGTFLPEMDASNKQETLAEKFAAVWEKKNLKAARAGGVSLMALSLAACGSSSDDTVAVVAPETPEEPETPDTPEEPSTPVAGKKLELKDATEADTLVGGDGDDTFTGVSGAYADTDSMIDPSTSDNDTATFVTKAAANPTIKNVETVTVVAESTGTAALDLSLVTKATTLNFSKGDVVIGGSTIAASSVVELDNVDAANVAVINVTGTVTNVDLDSASTDKAGIVLNANSATGDIDVDGAATINAAEATGTVRIDTASNTTNTELLKATVINADKATEIFTDTLLNGSIEINAAAATTITVEDASGGLVLNATKGATSANGIDVRGIDSTGAIITTGSYASTAAGTIDLGGTTATNDQATVSAAGTVTLDAGVATGAVDILTLEANGAAVTYTVSTSNGSLATTNIGTDVTAAGNGAEFTGTTVKGLGTLDLTAYTADALDLSNVEVGKVKIGFDNAHDPTANAGAGDHNITIKSGQTVEVYADQDDLEFDFASTETASDLTFIAGDVNGATNTAVGTLALGGVFRADSSLAGTVNIVANDSNLSVSTTTTFGAKQAVVITGDEDVSLGTVTAKSLDATESTGKITLISTTGLKTIDTGSGVDDITTNDASTKHTVSTGAGKDVITITATDDESSYDGGADADVINANETGKSYVVVGGDGDDVITTTGAISAVLVGGDGEDTFDVNTAGATDVSATTFRLTGFEKLDLVGLNETMTVTATQFADFNTVEVNGDGATDVLRVNAAATGSTIDASGLTIKTNGTVTLEYAGGAKDDVLTGSTAAETFIYSLGSDSISGGATGTDTLAFAGDTTRAISGSDTSTGVVINMSDAAVSDASIFAGIAQYTGNSADVDGGTVAHVFAAAKATNSTQITSFDDIEDVVGGDGRDYIVGSGGDNSIDGLGGADYITGGDGADTISGGAGNDVITLGNGADVLTFTTTQVDAGGGFLAANLADVAASVGEDTIASYVVADDTIKIYESIFGSDIDGDSDGDLDAAHFASVADAGTAINLDLTGGGFVYQEDTKELHYVNTDALTASDATTDELEELTEGTDYVTIATFTAVTGVMAATEFEIVA
jgi:Ca2+-binding RTX toxin-like protein